MQNILSFEYDNSEYFLIYDKKLKCAKKVNGELEFHLTKAEIKMVFYVFLKVIPTSNIQNLGSVYLKKKRYKHFLDLTNKIHVFYDEFGKAPEFHDFIALNKIYNNQDETIADIESDTYESENSDKNETFIKRIIQFKSKSFIGVKLYLCLFLAVLFATPVMVEASKIVGIAGGIYDEYYDDLTKSDFIAAIQDNPNLDPEEKEYFLSFDDFFTDMLPYWNYSDVVDSESKMTTSYYEKSGHGIAGNWDFVNRNMNIYNSSEFSEENKYVVKHEFFHTTSSKKGLMKLGIDRGFYEFLNMVICNEYDDPNTDSPTYDSGYMFVEDVGYMMLDLFDSETLKNYHANPDVKLLVNKLIEIIPDKDMAYSLISDFNDYFIAIEAYRGIGSNGKLLSFKTKEDFHDDMERLLPGLKENIRTYWEKKHNKSITSDSFIYFLYDKDGYCQDHYDKYMSCTLDEFKNSRITRYKPFVNTRLFDDESFALHLLVVREDSTSFRFTDYSSQTDYENAGSQK